MAKVKVQTRLEKDLMKLGYSADIAKKIVEKASDLEDEVDESELLELMTESEATARLTPNLKKTFSTEGKKNVWDFLDRNHETYEMLLDAESKSKYDKLGGTQEKNVFLLDFLKNRASNTDAIAFEKAMNEYKIKYETEKTDKETKYVSKDSYQLTTEKLTKKERELLAERAMRRAYFNDKISTEKKNDEDFETIFNSRLQKKLESEGVVVDTETWVITDKDGVPKMNGSSKMTYDNFVDSLIDSTTNWHKKSDGAPESVNVTVPVNGKVADAGYDKNLEYIKKSLNGN